MTEEAKKDIIHEIRIINSILILTMVVCTANMICLGVLLYLHLPKG